MYINLELTLLSNTYWTAFLLVMFITNGHNMSFINVDFKLPQIRPID